MSYPLDRIVMTPTKGSSIHGRSEKYMQHYNKKPEGKRPLGRFRPGWEDNSIIDLRERYVSM
jgi:hypothetical protein